MPTLYAGTSGFAFASWKPAFYPADVPSSRFLQHYASQLNCVEINYTFRRTPAASTLASWARQASPGFQFAIKAHQRITHVHRLHDAREPTASFLRALEPLAQDGLLGPVLFQLPPGLQRDLPRLTSFLQELPPGLRCAFEFRHPSWLTDDVYATLRQHNTALCVAEAEQLVIPEVITADFVYFRLRQPAYDEADVDAFATRARALLAAGHDLYVLFKHEDDPAGAFHAQRLLQLGRAAA